MPSVQTERCELVGRCIGVVGCRDDGSNHWDRIGFGDVSHSPNALTILDLASLRSRLSRVRATLEIRTSDARTWRPSGRRFAIYRSLLLQRPVARSLSYASRPCAHWRDYRVLIPVRLLN